MEKALLVDVGEKLCYYSFRSWYQRTDCTVIGGPVLKDAGFFFALLSFRAPKTTFRRVKRGFRALALDLRAEKGIMLPKEG